MESSLHSHGATGAPRSQPATLPLMQYMNAANPLPLREARLARVLADDRLNALLGVMFGVERWTVLPPHRFEAATPGLIDLRRGGETAQFAIDLSNWPALASAATDERRAPDPETELHAAVASILLHPLRQALESLGLDGVTAGAVRTHRGRFDPALHTVVFRVGEREIKLGIINIDDSWINHLETLVAEQCVPYPPCISSLAVPGRIELGTRTFSIAALASLRPGDIVLRAIQHTPNTIFGDTPKPLSAPITWGNPGMRQLSATVCIADNTLTLTGVPFMNRTTENDPISSAEPSEAPVAIGELDLPVKIEIDTVALPVAQLSALRAGYVLELPVPVREAQVRLVSYGQMIALGELVAVGDHIGVRIVRMCNQSVPV